MTPLTAKEVILIYGLMIALSLFLAYKSVAQEHDHGVNVPDWYDNDCCNNRDCKPVEDSEIESTVNALNQPVMKYKTMTYDKARWRKSQDERYHVCYRGVIEYCIYIPTSV